jgi:hypothetical protein
MANGRRRIENYMKQGKQALRANHVGRHPAELDRALAVAYARAARVDPALLEDVGAHLGLASIAGRFAALKLGREATSGEVAEFLCTAARAVDGIGIYLERHPAAGGR